MRTQIKQILENNDDEGTIVQLIIEVVKSLKKSEGDKIRDILEEINILSVKAVFDIMVVIYLQFYTISQQEWMNSAIGKAWTKYYCNNHHQIEINMLGGLYQII